MKWFLIIIPFLFMSDTIIVFDKNTNTNNWYIVNDGVMGGLSTSTININNTGKAVFSGEVSTKNNGGFAMTRLPLSIKLDDKKSKLVIKLKGDGKKYQFRIKSNRTQYFWYVQSFQTSTKTEEIQLNLNDFYASFRGYKLNLDNFSANTIKEIAILIGNKMDENFSLEIEKIKIK